MGDDSLQFGIPITPEMEEELQRIMRLTPAERIQEGRKRLAEIQWQLQTAIIELVTLWTDGYPTGIAVWICHKRLQEVIRSGQSLKARIVNIPSGDTTALSEAGLEAEHLASMRLGYQVLRYMLIQKVQAELEGSTNPPEFPEAVLQHVFGKFSEN